MRSDWSVNNQLGSYRASPPLCQPQLAFAGSRLTGTLRTRLPVLHPLPCACMLPGLCRGGDRRFVRFPCPLAFPAAGSLLRGVDVGLRIDVLEACTAFTPVMACMVAEAPATSPSEHDVLRQICINARRRALAIPHVRD